MKTLRLYDPETRRVLPYRLEVDERDGSYANVGLAESGDVTPGAVVNVERMNAAISAELAALLAGDAGDVLTADGEGGASMQPPAYLEWIAYVTQTGTNNPVVTVLKDDTSDQPVPFAPSVTRVDVGYVSFFGNGPWLDPGPGEDVLHTIPNVVSVTGMVSGDTDLPFARLPIVGVVTTDGFGFGMVSPTTMAGADGWQAYVHFKFFMS